MSPLDRSLPAGYGCDCEPPDHHASGWIDATVCVPAPLEDVLIVHHWMDGPGVDMGYRRKDGTWMLAGNEELTAEVSHWQRLPALPPELAEAAA